MTRGAFASLSSSAFSVVASKRIKLHEARAALDAFLDADPCDRRCKCERRPEYDRLVKAEADAYHEARVAEDMWAEYCEIRKEGDALRTGTHVA